jgi:hypothetical protein
MAYISEFLIYALLNETSSRSDVIVSNDRKISG